MEKMIVIGGKRLQGVISISGAKNAALPLMASSILTDQKLTLTNIPQLSDIAQMERLLAQHGVDISWNRAQKSCTLQAKNITNITAPYEIVSKMRASILVLGPLVARYGKAIVSLPGGCAIGTRPVNVHIDGLSALGAKIHITGGYIYAETSSEGLIGTEITIPVVSVTGSENLIMASVLAKGQTVLKNVAREPEVCNLAYCLVAMGAKIEGIGTDTLTIQGVESLHEATYGVIPDRIEAATYAVAGAITYGDIILDGVCVSHLSSFWTHMKRAGVQIENLSPADQELAKVRVCMDQDLLGVDVMTEPYPGFPTDVQAQFMALMTICKGASMITETIFENRFMHVLELCRMSADITVHKSSALVRGVKRLIGAPIMATDLRASVSLILAGLAAEGETTVQRIYHIDRGYESIEQKLQACGAVVERVSEQVL